MVSWVQQSSISFDNFSFSSGGVEPSFYEANLELSTSLRLITKSLIDEITSISNHTSVYGWHAHSLRPNSRCFD